MDHGNGGRGSWGDVLGKTAKTAARNCSREKEVKEAVCFQVEDSSTPVIMLFLTQLFLIF